MAIQPIRDTESDGDRALRELEEMRRRMLEGGGITTQPQPVPASPTPTPTPTPQPEPVAQPNILPQPIDGQPRMPDTNQGPAQPPSDPPPAVTQPTPTPGNPSVPAQPVMPPPPPEPPPPPFTPSAEFAMQSVGVPEFDTRQAQSMPGAVRGEQYQTPEGVFDAGGLGGALTQFAQNAMGTPNRYTTDAMQARLAAIDAANERSRDEGLLALEELMARRGIVGSSVEFTEGAGLLDRLNENTLDYRADLLRDMAAIDAQDRMAAGQLGLGAAGLNRSLDLDRLGENRFAAEFGRQQGRDFESDLRQRAEFGETQRQFDTEAQIRQRAMQLQAMGMNQDEAFRRAQAEQQESQFGRGLDVTRDDLAARREHQEFIEGLGLLELINRQDGANYGYDIHGNPPPTEPPAGQGPGYPILDPETGEWMWVEYENIS